MPGFEEPGQQRPSEVWRIKATLSLSYVHYFLITWFTVQQPSPQLKLSYRSTYKTRAGSQNLSGSLNTRNPQFHLTTCSAHAVNRPNHVMIPRADSSFDQPISQDFLVQAGHSSKRTRTGVGYLGVSADSKSVLHAREYLNLVLRLCLNKNVLRPPAEFKGEGEVRLCTRIVSNIGNAGTACTDLHRTATGALQQDRVEIKTTSE